MPPNLAPNDPLTSNLARARKQRAALMSIFASAGLALAKLVAGLLSGSLALLSEAGHGLIDTGATLMTWLAVKEAGKPADAEHPYGHAKWESLAALAETGMLLALAAFVMIEAVKRLAHETPVEASALVFGILLVSIGVDFMRWQTLAQVAREEKSEALAADALHFSTDLVSSVFVMAGLATTRLGFAQGDGLAAAAVAIFIGVAGFRLAGRTLDSLLDTAPLGLTERVRAIVAAAPGIVDVDAIRLRPAGAEVIGEIIVSVARTTPLERVADIKSRLRQQLDTLVPGANLTITANPAALDNESVLEQVLLVAARRRVPVHHVTVQKLNGKTSVSLDLEVNGTFAYGAAHEIASGLEGAIGAEIGAEVEVETHIEPLEVRELSGSDAPEAVRLAIDTCLQLAAQEGHAISDVHHVRVRNTPAGLVVNYHCRVDPALSVNAVHALVDPLDRAAKTANPAIVRIVGHAEPVGW